LPDVDPYDVLADVEAYNNMHKDAEPIQLILDFTHDVAERLAA
jgi:hypothetical protein